MKINKSVAIALCATLFLGVSTNFVHANEDNLKNLYEEKTAKTFYQYSLDKKACETKPINLKENDVEVKKLSTDELIEAIINHPDCCLLFLYSTEKQGFEVVSQNIPEYTELLKRKDAYKKMEAKLSSLLELKSDDEKVGSNIMYLKRLLLDKRFTNTTANLNTNIESLNETKDYSSNSILDFLMSFLGAYNSY